jgi:hypothetical protein
LHTIAENIILPATVDVVKAVIGPENAKKFKAIPLSSNMLSRRIGEMADDIHEQMINKESDFITFQCEKSTDVLNLTQFPCFVRYQVDSLRKICFFACQYLVVQQDSAS